MQPAKLYRRLCAQMALTGVERQALAKKVGISYETLRTKMNGKRTFTLDEAVQIKRLLRYEGTVEELFARWDDERAGRAHE